MLKEYAEGYFIGGHKKRHTKASVQELNNCFSQAFKDALNNELSYLAIFILIVAGGRFGEVQNYNVTI